MTQILLTLFILSVALHSMTLHDIIEISLTKNPSLESINAKITANKYEVDIADKFANPDLLLTKNTLSSDQAMSQTVVTFKQKIPYFSKRETRQKVALAEDEVLSQKLQYAKVTLVGMIRNEAYNIWELTKLKDIIQQYIELTKRNVALYEAYVSTTPNQHMGIMKAKLSLSELEIKISKLNAKIIASYANLSYLASFDISHIDIELQIAKKPELALLLKSLDTNPSLAIKEKELYKESAKVALADINRYPDFNLLASLSYRENFDNYANIGIGMTLPIYGTEDTEVEKAKAMTLVVKSEQSDLKIAIDSRAKVYYAQMLSAYEIYHIIQDHALVEVSHMFEISNSSISTGSDLFKYIDVLFQRLKLEEQSITAISNYNKAQAKIAELKGKL